MMLLPKLNTITYRLSLPSTKEEITYRPYTVEEEKILLTMQESDDSKDILRSMRQVLGNCVQEDLDIERLPTFDLEYLFLNVRGKSTGDEIELLLKHENSINSKGETCEHRQVTRILIDDIQVHFPEGHQDKFQLDENVGIKMKYPTFEALTLSQANNDFDQLIKLICSTVEIIYDKENVYNDFTKEEIAEWLEQLNQTQFGKLIKFFQDVPKLSHTVEWTCPECKQKDSIKLEGLQSFFT